MRVDTGALAIAPVGGGGPNRGDADAIQAAYIAVLEEIVGARVRPESHFFDDLGADSMLMTQFCARVRKRPELPRVSMKDVYRSPTIGGLVAALVARVEPKPKVASSQSPEQQLQQVAQTTRRVAVETGAMPPLRAAGVPAVPAEPSAPREQKTEDAPKVQPKGRPLFWLVGTLQIVWMLGTAWAVGALAALGYQWVAWRNGALDGVMRRVLLPELYQRVMADTGFFGVYQRAVLFGVLAFAVWCVVPVVAKWTLVGRWKPTEFRVWSLRYFRFWVVKSLVRISPLAVFVGTPLYSTYLRTLGAKIGRRVLILSPAPICTDLLRIGSGSVVRANAIMQGYRAQAGVIQIGPVSLGRDVFVSENTVLDINTEMGDGAELGHASSLHSGQSVPAGQSWHGSPARQTDVRFQRVGRHHEHWLRPYLYPAWFLAVGLFGVAPLLLAGMVWLLTHVPWVKGVLDPNVHVVGSWDFVPKMLVISAALLLLGYLLGVLAAGILPRLLNLGLRPDKDYPLYGVRYWLHWAVALGTNLQPYLWLFGDSSYITGYLRWIGYKLKPVVQTGSNFGLDVKHSNPFLVQIGTGTVIADGLSMMNAEYSNTSFRLSRTSIGAHNFLGNQIAYPAGGKTGDNCLLGTKVMIPIDGKVREGVGLLGSPAFEIPRTVERDNRFGLTDDTELKKRLRAKKRHNRTTMLLFLFSSWIQILGMTATGLLTLDLLPLLGPAAVALSGIPLMVYLYGHIVVVERLVRRFQTRVPAGCSIYDKNFWRHERYWKVSYTQSLQLFNGTPLKPLLYRLLGVRVGRRVFDDGVFITERAFATIGDNCTLNAGSIIQCHSQEDGAFKSDTIVVTDDVTLGVGAFLHYGTTVGYGATIEADSFLMKGEEVPAQTRWAGNPATEVRGDGVPHTGGFVPLATGGFAPVPALPPAPSAPALPAPSAADPWRPQPRPRAKAKVARPELAVAEAIGSVVWDGEGHPFLDFATEPGSRLLGHNHPEVAKARTPHQYWCVDQQAAVKMTRGSFIESQRSMVPEPMRWRTRMRFCSAAEDPVTVALDLCRDATGRRDVLSLHADAAPEVVESLLRSMQYPAALLMTLTRGTRLASPELVREAREVTRRMRIPLVIDETETGGGRTGAWFAFEHYGIEPDAVISSTSVTDEAGDPLDVVLYDARLEPRGGHPEELPAGNTALFADACSVIIARRDDVLANVRERGAQLGELLADLREHPAVHDVDGAGLLWGVRFAEPGDGRTAAHVAADVRDFAFRAGLIVRHDGPDDGMVRLEPPLTVAGEVVDVAASILRFAIEAAHVMCGDRRALTGRSEKGPARTE